MQYLYLVKSCCDVLEERQSLARCEKLPEYSTGYRGRRGERQQSIANVGLQWGGSRSWNHKPMTQRQREPSVRYRFGLRWTALQNFKLLVIFPALPKTIAGSQVMQERDRYHSPVKMSHILLAAAGFWVLPVFTYGSLSPFSAVFLLWFWQHRNKLWLLTGTTYAVERVFSEGQVHTGWTVGLIFSFQQHYAQI